LEPTQYHLHTQTWSQNLIPFPFLCSYVFFLLCFQRPMILSSPCFSNMFCCLMILTSSNAPFNAWVSIFAWYGSPSYYGFYVFFFILYLYFFLSLFHLYIFVLVVFNFTYLHFLCFMFMFIWLISLCSCHHLFLVIFKLAISMWGE
jgi:hypothetical protein